MLVWTIRVDYVCEDERRSVGTGSFLAESESIAKDLAIDHFFDVRLRTVGASPVATTMTVVRKDQFKGTILNR